MAYARNCYEEEAEEEEEEGGGRRRGRRREGEEGPIAAVQGGFLQIGKKKERKPPRLGPTYSFSSKVGVGGIVRVCIQRERCSVGLRGGREGETFVLAPPLAGSFSPGARLYYVHGLYVRDRKWPTRLYATPVLTDRSANLPL